MAFIIATLALNAPGVEPARMGRGRSRVAGCSLPRELIALLQVFV
jgi:hypothetical protein